MKISVNWDSEGNIKVMSEDEKIQLIQVSFFNQAININPNKKVESVLELLKTLGFKLDDLDF